MASAEFNESGRYAMNKGEKTVTTDPALSNFEVKIDTTKKTVAKATSSLKAHAQTAGRLATLTAERTKIANVSLPSAYSELGKQCYQTRSCEKEFPELFRDIDALAEALQTNSTAKPTSTATSFTDKAKALAEKGIQVANNQKLVLQQKVLFARLGRQAYETLGEHVGPDALIKAIEPLTARLVVLEKELAVNVQKAGGKKRVAIIGGGILVALVILAAMLGDLGNKVTRKERGASRSTASTKGNPSDHAFAVLRQCKMGSTPEFVESLMQKEGLERTDTQNKTQDGKPRLIHFYGPDDAVFFFARKNASGAWGLALVRIDQQGYLPPMTTGGPPIRMQ